MWKAIEIETRKNKHTFILITNSLVFFESPPYNLTGKIKAEGYPKYRRRKLLSWSVREGSGLYTERLMMDIPGRLNIVSHGRLEC